MLAGGRTFEQINFADLAIITFNYDRSLEFYLHTALRNSYGKTDKEVADKLDELRLIHVHGSLGRLPWQPDIASAIVPFGSCANVYEATKSLKILHETTDESPEFEEARNLIRQAQHVYFLGFGFHSANLRRLGVNDAGFPGVVRGTIQGLAPTVRNRVAEEFTVLSSLHSIASPTELWQDKDVYNYLRDHVSL